MDKKKAYEQPEVKQVRLEVKNAVLAVCFTSTITTPDSSPGGACQDPGVGCESDS
jgi:hypothetical protein